MEKQYKIFKNSYYDKYGKMTDVHYYIKKRKSFLGKTYWRLITHLECSMSDCYKAKTTFKTIEEAQDFIKKILCKDKTFDGWTKEEMKTCKCY